MGSTDFNMCACIITYGNFHYPQSTMMIIVLHILLKIEILIEDHISPNILMLWLPVN